VLDVEGGGGWWVWGEGGGGWWGWGGVRERESLCVCVRVIT